MINLAPLSWSKRLTIGVVAPASPMRNADKLADGIRFFESRGHDLVFGESVHEQNGNYLAGSDEARLDDLVRMFERTDIDLIICTRGGYGTPRLLQQLPYAHLAPHAKPLLGFSDITALQLALLSKCGIPSYSGVMLGVDSSPTMEQQTEAWLGQALAQHTISLDSETTPSLRSVRAGEASGQLICGNLCLICSLIGSGYLPDLHGAILVVEDIGEPAYKIDRYLRQLEISDISQKLSGIVFGVFNGANVDSPAYQRDLHELFVEFADRADIPCLSGLPYGHVSLKLTLPLGGSCSFASTSDQYCSIEFNSPSPHFA